MASAYRFPSIRPDMPPPDAWRAYLDEAYANGWFTNFGPLSRRLETAFADRWGGRETRCIAAASATAALAAPLIANAIEGDVLLPAFTFPATLGAVKSAGAIPLLIDVARDDWTIAPAAVDDALRRTGAKAVILGAPFGFRRDFAPHAAVARKHGAIVIIDNAAGVGVERRALEGAPASTKSTRCTRRSPLPPAKAA
jgi:dTDP-4-amino-4,6-dideoxygalactose transaminase